MAEKLVLTFAMNRLACCKQLWAISHNSLHYRQCYGETRVWGRYTVYKTSGVKRVKLDYFSCSKTWFRPSDFSGQKLVPPRFPQEWIFSWRIWHLGTTTGEIILNNCLDMPRLSIQLFFSYSSSGSSLECSTCFKNVHGKASRNGNKSKYMKVQNSPVALKNRQLTSTNFESQCGCNYSFTAN